MSSSGTASDITAQDASDLLHKLITESTKVQVAFRSAMGVVATLAGVITVAHEGQFCIQGRDEVPPSLVMFTPSLASVYKYGDHRAFTPDTLAIGPSFASALTFVFADNSTLTLFEIA
jgi:hypothetical protein